MLYRKLSRFGVPEPASLVNQSNKPQGKLPMTAVMTVPRLYTDAAGDSHGTTNPLIAIGFSNGCHHGGGAFAGAVLFRPLSPFKDNQPSHLDGIPVLVIDGEKDSRRLPGDGARLAERFRDVGAMVTYHVLRVGHSITSMDQQIAGERLERER